MKKIVLFFSILLIAMCAYSQTRFIPTSSKAKRVKGYRWELGMDSVAIYFDKKNVPLAEIQIGLINARERRIDIAYKKAKKLCAKYGGNALLQISQHDMTEGDKLGKFFIGGRTFNGRYLFKVYKQKAK